MSKFTVRVELHDSEDADYDDLHDAMEARGFERTIVVNGERLHLPDAEYTYQNNVDSEAVYDEARAAVDEIGKEAGIVVTKSAGGRFVGGLREA